ncbi:MAG: DEAD/DEAH box helicase [Lachnotalea sp.]
MNFKDLNLSPLLLKALDKKGYVMPSPIQEKAIPYVLEGRDVLGCAQTGTGKTAAFALPILQNLMSNTNIPKKRNIRSLILTPTRELALQISDNFKEYAAFTQIKCCVIFGGISAKPQIEELRNGVDILVATPGRLNDLIGQKEVDLSNVEIFVLDETDCMLDMGFIHDVKKIISLLPNKRQTLLFSATLPAEIKKLISQLLTNPVKVEVSPVSSTVDLIDAVLYYVDKGNKRQLLTHILKNNDITSTLVFTRTKHGADRVSKYLEKAKIKSSAIHGDKSQGARQLALNNFKSGKIRVLVATDIAARGIDISQLSCVINFDLPNTPETYVHRIGRTGRAGLDGKAISFCSIEEKEYVTDIEKLIKKKIPVIIQHPFPMIILTVEPKETKQRPKKANNIVSLPSYQAKNKRPRKVFDKQK